ncbi:MAG TPA: response regulator [Mycobacteriales bacterium]|jgi:CheY-like chemotaxis protein|nr:response regulator [Mycobacteriales bacterium]
MARILLVDDRPENLLALEAILSVFDHELVRASSGDEALKALLTQEFAVILLDVSMPGMDGLETAAHIKSRERTRDVPIIFLTAVHPDAEHAFRGYSAGAVDYVAKPFDPWVLRAKVAVFVDLYCKRQQLQEQATLLRRRLTGPDAGSGRDLAAELAERLAAVETAFAALRPLVTDPATAPVTADLAAGLTRLRDLVDALDAR